jgi:pyridoxal phosphate enzyme (YggS family)
MSIASNISEIRKDVPESVVIVAASKTRTVEEIQEAISAGINVIGENYVQEAEEKFKVLKGKVKFYCIGQLQTNKVKKAVKIFDMIQTVDSLKIAKEIDKRCKSIDKVMPILIEINSGEEENKSGCMPEKVEELVKEVSELQNVKVKGLMTMAPFFDDAEKARPYFKKTKGLFDRIKGLEILSMGMSHSYKVAISEGANMVRIGTKIFGEREY